MASPEIIIDEYKFSNFGYVDAEYKVTFRVERIRNIDKQLTNRDIDSFETVLKSILNDLGKWEKLIVGNLYLLSELKIRQIDETILKNYEKTSEIDFKKYKPLSVGIQSDRRSSHYYLLATITLEDGELIKRQEDRIDPIFSIEEFTNPLMNVPKWKALKKTVTTIREELL